MSEKRFKVDYEVGVLDTKTNEIICDTVNAKEVADLLNEQQATISQLQDLCGESDGENAKLRIENKEQQATIKVYEEGLTMKIKKINEQQALITNLQGDVNRLQYIIDELKKDNYKRFEKINELKAKLKEKEEDEKLYANEILELRETNKEHIKFKSLGGNY